MRTIAIYGHSDDLVEIDGTDRGAGETDEITAPFSAEGGDGPVLVEFRHPQNGSMIVCAHYAPDASRPCWMIGLMQTGEDIPLPDWPMRWSSGEYTVRLEIDVPDGTVIRSPSG